jgi:hypothetical protein
VQLQALLNPMGLATRCRGDLRDRRHSRVGALQWMSGWWLGRREQAGIRRAIRNFGKAGDHLLQDIGVDRLGVRYGLTEVASNGQVNRDRANQCLPEMAMQSPVVEFAPLQRRD